MGGVQEAAHPRDLDANGAGAITRIQHLGDAILAQAHELRIGVLKLALRSQHTVRST